MSQFPTKKRKLQNDTEKSMKKTRKEGKTKTKKKGKGKARETMSDDGSEFRVVKGHLVVSIPPIFASSPKTGVEEMLDSMVMRYIPAFRGVVLAHSNLHFLDKTATIKADCPFSVCNIGFDATVWSPHVRMKLVGKVNLCSPDHVSLLVHRTFNVSIPRHHIPTAEWEFEYGPAENDPEFGVDAQGDGKADSETPGKEEGENGGRWVHKITGDKLGGAEGFLEFTVIGLTVANEMLSLLGSIQVDPFSLSYFPESGPPIKASQFMPEDEGEQDEPPTISEGDNIESDEDTFQRLGRKVNEVAAEEASRKAVEAELVIKAKKRKRKGGLNT